MKIVCKFNKNGVIVELQYLVETWFRSLVIIQFMCLKGQLEACFLKSVRRVENSDFLLLPLGKGFLLSNTCSVSTKASTEHLFSCHSDGKVTIGISIGMK